MTLELRTPRYADDRYAAQRRLGFPWLRFVPDLEEEFRAGHAATSAQRIRASYGFGLLAVVALALIGRVPSEAFYVALMYVYFVSGLTFYRAVACAVVLSAVFVGTNLYQAYFALLANGVGGIGLYLLERQARLAFLLTNELEQQALLDGLTGLMNRRAFTTRIETIWRQARRNLCPVGIVLLDIDGFKKVNDSRGHPFGDEVLRHVGAVLKGCALRPLDIAARYGGDEFVAVWYDVDGAWFAKMAEELPAKLALQGVTVSGGAVLAWPKPDLTPRDAIKLADKMLYDGKRAGGNRIGHMVLRKDERARAA